MLERVDTTTVENIVKFVKNYKEIDNEGNEIKAEVYESLGYINLLAVRTHSTTGKFDDVLYVYWKNIDEKWVGVKTSGFTTKPSKPNKNSKRFMIVEGWHKNVYASGFHKNKNEENSKHWACRQFKSIPYVEISTINSLSGEYTRKSINVKQNNFDANLHRYVNYQNAITLDGEIKFKPNDVTPDYVRSSLIGSQVFQSYEQHKEFMERLVDPATAIGQTSFSYLLVSKKTLDEYFKKVGVKEDTSLKNGKPKGSKSEKSKPKESKSKESEIGKSGVNLGEFGKLEKTGNKVSDEVSDEVFYDEVEIDNDYTGIFATDNNNKYIDMEPADVAIIRDEKIKPELKPDTLKISDKYYATIGVNPEEISFYTPLVYINDFLIPQTNITNFCLDYSSFLPQVMVEFVDMTNELLSTNIPKPGSYIKVYIGAYDDIHYRPIRQDFIITNISKTNKTGGDYQNLRNPLKYKITGTLNVPLGFKRGSWSSGNQTACKVISHISQMMGLGFATNFEKDDDKDYKNEINMMKWQNDQNKSYFDFIKHVTKHACHSPYTFFTSFIDQYYYLNFVECRRLLSHGGKLENTKQIIYSSIKSNMREKNKSVDENEKKEDFYFISNSEEYKGWTNYIEEYYELNDGYSVMSDGYSKYVGCSSNWWKELWNKNNIKIHIRPIDNLYRDRNGIIKPLPYKIKKDTYIPLNLIETTNNDYRQQLNSYTNPTSANSLVDFDGEKIDNVHKLYYYAQVQNDFQMKFLKKCGISVRLQNYNPSITKYSRIWVEIYDMHRNSSVNIRKDDRVDDLSESIVKTYLKEKNDDIIIFDDERGKDNEYQVFNRSLSGWYVVTEMKILYNTVKDFQGNTYKKLQTQLILNRIDYKPTFRSEYNIAKLAVDKYMEENHKIIMDI